MEYRRHYFTLDEEDRPVEEPSVVLWAQWMEANRPRLAVGHDLVAGEVQVMTWFVGCSSEQPTKLWQTQVKGGVRDGLVQQYSCLDEALRGHERVLRVVTRAETRSHADGPRGGA